MKTKKTIGLVHLVLLLFSFPLLMTAGNENMKNNKDVKLTDSLKIFDSLITANKIKNSPRALAYARISIAIATRVNTPEAWIKAYSSMGNAFSQNSKDSSYYFYAKALKLTEQDDKDNQRPRIIYDIALLYNAAYNYKTTLVLLDSSIRMAAKCKDYKLLSNGYSTLGNVKYQTNDYTGSRQAYDFAFNIAKAHSLFDEMGFAYGNLGKFEKDSMKFIRIQKEAIRLLKINPGNEEEIAQLLTNIGYMSSSPDTAIYYYNSALKMIKDGISPDVEIGVYNNMVYSYLAKGEKQDAEQCLLLHAIPLAMKENNKDWLSTLYDSYADILKVEGKYKEEAESRKKSNEYHSEADFETGSEQVRLLSSLLELKNKDQEILVKNSSLKQTRLWLAISLLLVILSTFLFISLGQRNRIRVQRQRIATANRIIELEENEKGRVARELHDITGQMVLSISEEIAEIKFPDPQIGRNLLEKIEKIGKNLRSLSHRMNKAMIEKHDVNELVIGLCEDFHKLTGLLINLELPEKDYQLLPETVVHIYRIIQELLMNAGKYCKGELVRIRIIAEDKKLAILYIDNGPGFDPEKIKGTGMGIINITERTKLIGGKAVLESSPGSGVAWKITVPLNDKRIY
jgi:signal transduction histidine kinase